MRSKIPKIGKLGERYFAEFLQDDYRVRTKIKKDWYRALLFFYGKSFYRGRRDEVSKVFELRAIKSLGKYQLKRKINKFSPKRLERVLQKNKVNNHKDRRMVIETIQFIKKIPRKNIVDYSIEKIRSGETEEIFSELDSIYAIGDKLASLYLRDVVLIYKLEKYVSENDFKYFQPIDTWVKQVTDKLGITDEKLGDLGSNKIRDLSKQQIIRTCLKVDTSPLLFNAGAWYLGAHSFEIVIENL